MGGAIDNQGHNLTVSDCNFTNNRVSSSGGSGGGAIRNNGVNVTVNNCNFTSNRATYGGGAIINYGVNFNVNGSNFISNTVAVSYSGSGGGAISNIGSYAIISNSNFTNNTLTGSTFGGGAIYNEGLNLSVKNVSFNGNNAGTTSGGAIHNNAINLTVEISTFLNNRAYNGGAIFNNASNASVIYSNFTNNNATNFGGGIYNNGSLFVSSNRMNGNNANNLGKVIYNAGKMGSLNLTYLNNETVDVNRGPVTLYVNLTDDMGNPITGQNISFYINETNFVGNVAVNEGIATIPHTIPSSATAGIYATISGDYEGHNNQIIYNSGQLRLSQQVNLSITKTAIVTGNVTNGQIVTYIINVSNFGPDIAKNVLVCEKLQNSLIFVSAETYGVGSYNPLTGEWNIGDLNNNTSVILLISFKVNATTNGGIVNITNVVNITSDGNNTGQNETNATIAVIPGVNITITKTVTNTNPSNGDIIAYTITVTNHGPDDATDINITENLDSRLLYLNSTASIGNYDVSSHLWTIGVLSQGGQETLTIFVRINGTGLINNIVIANTLENNIGENNTSKLINANPKYNLSIAKIVNVTQVLVGQNVEYTITLTNNGPDLAPDVCVFEKIANGLIYVNSSVTFGNYDLNDGIWYIGPLANGQSVKLIIIANVIGSGKITNIAYLSLNGRNGPIIGTDNVTIVSAIHTLIKTSLSIHVELSSDKKTMFIQGKLLDEFGNILVNKIVDFYVNGIFAGIGITDMNGIAKISYPSQNPFKNGIYIIKNVFNGDNLYSSSFNSTILEIIHQQNIINETENSNNPDLPSGNNNSNNPDVSNGNNNSINPDLPRGNDNSNNPDVSSNNGSFNPDVSRNNNSNNPNKTDEDDKTEGTYNAYEYKKMSISVEMKKTGIPIVSVLISMLVLVLFAFGIRRRRYFK